MDPAPDDAGAFRFFGNITFGDDFFFNPAEGFVVYVPAHVFVGLSKEEGFIFYAVVFEESPAGAQETAVFVFPEEVDAGHVFQDIQQREPVRDGLFRIFLQFFRQEAADSGKKGRRVRGIPEGCAADAEEEGIFSFGSCIDCVQGFPEIAAV